ncbi:elongation factor G [Actinomadura montaniterrae]|uniref:TetM/TetW/TetO/TetS family tetracycline resistance ribosomal protection protein n=1 Tax=Actinomadura montaniterrae TaxID=1803903 RepID=A0A6L3VKI4_9ACTN|nr:TetM/TetW/TetO/TetS family tetracycline resistance ribosomal protection protein [Actinomadura montaniterrae]KAB2370658.1 TetM/TetW/TetO/TetS family tetracycline resistance ribosomal protection protein [Actinomadura montaniterrae]KAB2371500.1 TetM/TetW/TetO/TetS family tetracycline resistance ribosomal protection protein [Actinomadura montaniterrae]
MPTLNLGILAHVDAGKTSLTERLLFDTGAIARLGSVDAGDTQTDRGELERGRGITIRSAVAPFRLGALRVNLIDTPGHADFAAEVERALGVLDGAVLVLSAVEGVQARTRVLLRALRALALPTLIFVNKIDRMGADPDAVLAALGRRPGVRPVPLNRVRDGRAVPCAPSAEILADGDDALLADFVEGRATPPEAVRAALRAQTAAAAVQPLYFGSAVTGAGVGDLLDGIASLLPPAGPGDGETRGTVFAVERAPSGGRVAYLRLFSGEVRTREHVVFEGGRGGRITGLDIAGAPGGPLTAGNIAAVRGLAEVRVGDRIGPPVRDVPPFPPPSLETIVRARRPADAGRLRAALLGFADEDPLIRARPVPSGATSVLLYGEVQKEVIAARLLAEAGVEAIFEESRIVYAERPAGTGEAVEEMDWRRRVPDFWASVGLRVEPAPRGSGNAFRRETEPGALPHAFDRAIEETVHRTLEQGLRGWPVTDCAVVLTRSGYAAPVSTAGDFRGLTPLILMAALARAGTRVYEPCHAFEAEVPGDALSPVLAALGPLGATAVEPEPGPAGWTIKGEIPAGRAREAEAALPALTRGEGTWWSEPSGERRVTGAPPSRPRTGGDPLDRAAYLRGLSR